MDVQLVFCISAAIDIDAETPNSYNRSEKFGTVQMVCNPLDRIGQTGFSSVTTLTTERSAEARSARFASGESKPSLEAMSKPHGKDSKTLLLGAQGVCPEIVKKD